MNNDILRVETISQALPYIQKFREKIFVVKYGGAAMTDPVLKKMTINDLVLLNCVGIKIVLVHGGGPEISSMCTKLNLPVKFIDGLRVTDHKTMEIVEMVLVGKVQKELVNLINVSGGNAIGLSGKDGKLFSAKPIKNITKFGLIGDVDKIDISILNTLLEKGFIPVISSVAADSKGQNYNINADSVAYAVAMSLKASKLFYMTDTPGILTNPRNPSTLISKLSIKMAQSLINKKIIIGGMIPKTRSAIDAIKHGVSAVHIINGSEKHSILLEVLTDNGRGTMIVK